MYVADNEYLKSLVTNVNLPLFVGFNKLGIWKNDTTFVKNTPECLRPTLLSEVLHEDIDNMNMEEIETPLLVQLKDFLSSKEFKEAILRVMHHFKLKEGVSLSDIEKTEVLAKLDCVTVKQVNVLNLIVSLHGKEVGRRRKLYFVEDEIVGETRRLTLSISKNVHNICIMQALCKTYRRLLKLDTTDIMEVLLAVFSCSAKPHDVRHVLDELDITSFASQRNEDTVKLFQSDIGSYLKVRYYPYLDNSFHHFNDGEVVCMKKSFLGEELVNNEDEDTYIIVKVRKLVKRSGKMFLSEYEVDTGCEANPYMVVKAHLLCKFVRNNAQSSKNIVPFAEGAHVSDDNIMSEEDIMKMIRKEVKEIWQVKDEKEKRHLLRRLMLKWHPDKNMDRAELCTRVMQYIQSLMSRLERGETIPNDEDPTKTTTDTRSGSNEDIFRPPGRFYTNFSRRGFTNYSSGFSDSTGFSSDYSSGFSPNNSGGFSSHSRITSSKIPDRPEAQKWYKQAQHDYEEARRRISGSPCWISYICHQVSDGLHLVAI